MSDRDLDSVFAQAAGARHEVDPSPLERVKKSVLPAVSPVTPLGAPSLYVAAFLGILILVAVGAAALLGMNGFRALSGGERVLIFAVLAASSAGAAVAVTREMRPAAGRRIGAWMLPASAAAVTTAFVILFHNYETTAFVRQGIPCLRAGLVCAIPAALLVLVVMRRGFVLDAAAAGIAVGTLAGLAGMTMLEIHCPNLKLIHVAFWHTAVILSSGAAGWLTGRIRRAL